MSKIIQITPCTDWYYAYIDKDDGDWFVSPIAAWALTDTGEVLGLLPASYAGDPAKDKNPHLVPVPNAVVGHFVHESKLSERQKTAAARRPHF